jgi:hypothetical protein
MRERSQDTVVLLLIAKVIQQNWLAVSLSWSQTAGLDFSV